MTKVSTIRDQRTHNSHLQSVAGYVRAPWQET